jgi:hypothetical protein
MFGAPSSVTAACEGSATKSNSRALARANASCSAARRRLEEIELEEIELEEIELEEIELEEIELEEIELEPRRLGGIERRAVRE